ncbi:MAG: hypothetical protein K2G32_04645, partial [Oscillospiraceae bacterium]|nr:hypothetical protein [Oscillospiraceae bacterium]
VNAPYSQISVIVSALTESGGGQYNTFLQAKENNPELLNDYRVKPVLVKGLGASYSELADEVADTITKMGRDMLPLLKNGFDPKGKKEMLRRVSVIERIAGAEENDFYLEQLEDAEKDVRKVLIYALRHDERNTDKLIGLAKTEKGKPKTAALAALISFDNEKAAAFFEEYSEKKPAEVVELLKNASSEWTSRLTGRLINELLVNEKKEPITLTMAAENTDKTNFWALEAALWGKWGENIENIYRHFSNKHNSMPIDVQLGESILVTNNDDLKRLAVELNNNSNMKGHYTYAETIVRLLDSDDSTEWIAKQIIDVYEQGGHTSREITDSRIMRALNKVFIDDGKYYLTNAVYDNICDGYSYNKPRLIAQQLKGAVSDALMKCHCWDYDRLLGNWIDENDKEYCQKIGMHFCDRLRHFGGREYVGSNESCSYIKRCGFWNVKDLPLDYFKNSIGTINGYTTWVMAVVQDAPGDDEYRLEQARAIVKFARESKAVYKFDIDHFESWAETRYNHKM